jgi:uncharacterized Zn-binding protein involved in type VI secretion
VSQYIARLGDSSSHGGAVVAAAAKWTCMGARIARRGDAFACPIHGLQSIAAGSSKYVCEGAPIARHGDPVTCGATLIAGQSSWVCGG